MLLIAAAFNEEALRFPIGTGDFETVAGNKNDLNRLRNIPPLTMLGDRGASDAVPYGVACGKPESEMVREPFEITLIAGG